MKRAKRSDVRWVVGMVADKTRGVVDTGRALRESSGVGTVLAVCLCVALASALVLAFRPFFKELSQATVAPPQVGVRGLSPEDLEIDAKWREKERVHRRNHLAHYALQGLLACPPGPNDAAKDRSPEALAELATLYANELVALEDVPVRTSAEIKREAWAFRNEMMEACGGQVLTLSQLEALEALESDARKVRCAELRAQWEIDRVKLREEIARERAEDAARVERGQKAIARAKEIRAKHEGIST
jgi:hypothetical protein